MVIAYREQYLMESNGKDFWLGIQNTNNCSKRSFSTYLMMIYI